MTSCMARMQTFTLVCYLLAEIKSWLIKWEMFSSYFTILAQAANPSAEQVLISTLMRTYNRNARPVFDRKRATNVTFGLEVVQLVNVVRLKSSWTKKFIAYKESATDHPGSCNRSHTCFYVIVHSPLLKREKLWGEYHLAVLCGIVSGDKTNYKMRRHIVPVTENRDCETRLPHFSFKSDLFLC